MCYVCDRWTEPPFPTPPPSYKVSNRGNVCFFIFCTLSNVCCLSLLSLSLPQLSHIASQFNPSQGSRYIKSLGILARSVSRSLCNYCEPNDLPFVHLTNNIQEPQALYGMHCAMYDHIGKIQFYANSSMVPDVFACGHHTHRNPF